MPAFSNHFSQQYRNTAKFFSRFWLTAGLLFCLAGVCRAGTIRWTGNVSSDWNSTTNWSPQKVPLVGDDVQIGIVTFNNAPVINATVRCASVTFGCLQSITLTINSPAGLIITGNILQLHSENDAIPGTMITGTGYLTCASLSIGNGTPNNLVGVRTTILASNLPAFNVTGDIALNSATAFLLSGGISHNDSYFSLQGGQLNLTGQIKLTNSIPLYLTGGVLILTPSSKFSVDNAGSQVIKLKLFKATALKISDIQWNTVDFYHISSQYPGQSVIEYAGGNQTVFTSSTAGLDTVPDPYDNLIISGSGTKQTESSSGDVLEIAGYLNVLGNLNLALNTASLVVGGDFSNPGVTALSKSNFYGINFNNRGSLSTTSDTVKFSGYHQMLRDSTLTGTTMTQVLLAAGSQTIKYGNFIIPSTGSWTVANDSTSIHVAPNAELMFRTDALGQSHMIFKSPPVVRPSGYVPHPAEDPLKSKQAGVKNERISATLSNPLESHISLLTNDNADIRKIAKDILLN